jgi:hypothetical protein
VRLTIPGHLVTKCEQKLEKYEIRYEQNRLDPQEIREEGATEVKVDT